jgi:hypothetical protein
MNFRDMAILATSKSKIVMPLAADATFNAIAAPESRLMWPGSVAPPFE